MYINKYKCTVVTILILVIFTQAKENEVETKKAVNKLLQDNIMKAKLEEKLKVSSYYRWFMFFFL